jgi:fluoroacetyl-CoA thioesterase
MRAEVLGHTAEVRVRVTPEMVAALDGVVVHPVCSTFWIAYYAEVAARRAIEPFFEEGENAIGAALHLEHIAMAPVGSELLVRAVVERMEGNRVWCRWEAFAVGQRIAQGEQLQVILPHERIQALLRQAYERADLEPPPPHPNVRITRAGADAG